MSDPSILLLLTCITCAEGTELSQANREDCTFSQEQDRIQPGDLLLTCANSVSSPETILASSEVNSSSIASVQTIAATTIPRPTPPETFAKPQTTASYIQVSTQASTQNSPSSTIDSSTINSPVSSSALLKWGSRGTAVSRLQQELRQLGYYTGEIDGIYGRLTFTAVMSFQQAEGLGVDGVAGPITLTRLQTLVAPPAQSRPEPETESNAADTTEEFVEESVEEQPDETGEEGTESVEAGNATAEASQPNDPISPTESTDKGTNPKLDSAPDLESSSESNSESNPEPNSESNSEPDSEPDSEAEPAPDFVVDTSPSGGPFYFWVAAWAVVYLGGMLFIFRNSISSRMGWRWDQTTAEDETDQVQVPLVKQSDAIASFTYSQAVQYAEATSATSHASDEQKESSVSQLDRSLLTDELKDIPQAPEQAQTNTADKPTTNQTVDQATRQSLDYKPVDYKPVDYKPVDYKIDYESFLGQMLIPVWANGGVVEPVKGLFSDLPPLDNELLERRRNRAIANSESRRAEAAQPSTQTVNGNTPNDNASSTLIAVLPADDPETGGTYTYELIDNAKGYFVLQGNELRIYDRVLGQIESNVDHEITLRRTDAEGSQVDKSFVVSLAKAEDDEDDSQALPHSA